MKKFAIALGTSLTTLPGCLGVEGEQPLTPEHAEILSTMLEHEPEATSMAMELATHMQKGAVDATGQTTTGEKLSADLEKTAKWLQQEYNGGRIMEVDASALAEKDAAGEYDPESSETPHDDRIVLNNDTSTWSMPLILHEAGHKTFSHDPFVVQEIRDGGTVLGETFARSVIDHRDYPYLLHALYAVPSLLVESTRQGIEEARETAEAKRKTEGDVAAQQWLKEELAMPDEATMEERIAEGCAPLEGMFAEFGMTMDDVTDAYKDSGIHEALTEWRAEEIAAFKKESRRELERPSARL